MSKTIRKILGEAYEFIRLAPKGILNDGQVSDGVDFANEVINRYNRSSLFPFMFSTLETTVSGGSLAISSQPEPGEVLAEVPVGMAAAYWKRSETDMVEMRDCSYPDIFSVRNSSSSPFWYSLVTETDEHATLSFDALGSFKVLLVYPKKFPHLDIDDTFNAPDIYAQVIKYGVAVLAAQKATLEESVIAGYEKNLEDAVRAIRKSNASKRPVKHRLDGGYNHHEEFIIPRCWRR